MDRHPETDNRDELRRRKYASRGLAPEDKTEGEPMRSAGELAQEEAASEAAEADNLGTPQAGGGA